MAQIFKAKTLVSSTGRFSHEVTAPNLVYTTGDQNIFGNKTFLNNINVSGSGVFNALDLNNIDTLSLSGVDISITSGNIALTNRPTVNGTGVLLSGEVVNFSLPNTIVYTTGDQTISGVKTFATGVNISGHVGIGIDSNNFNLYVRKSPAGVSVNPDSNSIAVFEGSGNSHITVLASDAQTAGVVLGSPTDNFGSYLTWNHDNSALKLGTAKTSGFIQILTNNENEAVRITRSGDVGIGTISPSEKLQVVGNILANNLVYNTGNQTINGLKTFTSGIDIYSGTSPQSLRIFNSTGTNSGEFALIGWQPNLGIVSTGTNALVIGTQASNSGILRDLIITGENIALYPRSGRLYVNGTASLNDYLLQTSQCSGNITGFITGIGFTGNYTGNYEGGYFLGRTKLSQNTVQLLDSNFGNNFIRKSTNAPSERIRSIAVSSDGRYQIAAVGDYGATVGYVYVSNDYGNTWTPRITDTTRAWRGVAISADGKYQTACHHDGFIYVSNDYGNTWTAKDSIRLWRAVAMSSDGKYQAATGGVVGGSNIQIYISSDYGNTWKAKGATTAYNSITMSSDGKYQYAGAESLIYRSFDYGNTWTSSVVNGVTSIATSADGKFIIIGRTNSTLLISNNYGASFATKSISTYYFSVAVSDNGKYMVAGAGAYFVTVGGIYFSSDYGNTWRVITPSTQVWAVAMSSNAKYVIAASSSSSIPIHIFKTDELIDGNLTINNNLTLPSGDFYSYNATGVNSGEFGLIGWRNNQFVIGSQNTGSGILRDVVITGNNININGSGVLNIFDNTNIVGNLNVTGNILLSGNQVLTGSSTLYATSANLASTGSTLQTNINNLSGYINSTSSNIVFTTGNQIISGVKSFAQDTTFGDSAQGDFLVISGNNFTVYGSGNFTSGLFVNGNQTISGNLNVNGNITRSGNSIFPLMGPAFPRGTNKRVYLPAGLTYSQLGGAPVSTNANSGHMNLNPYYLPTDMTGSDIILTSNYFSTSANPAALLVTGVLAFGIYDAKSGLENATLMESFLRSAANRSSETTTFRQSLSKFYPQGWYITVAARVFSGANGTGNVSYSAVTPQNLHIFGTPSGSANYTNNTIPNGYIQSSILTVTGITYPFPNNFSSIPLSSFVINQANMPPPIYLMY